MVSLIDGKPELGAVSAGLGAHHFCMNDFRDRAPIEWRVSAPDRPPVMTSKAARALLVLMESARRRRRKREQLAMNEAA